MNTTEPALTEPALTEPAPTEPAPTEPAQPAPASKGTYKRDALRDIEAAMQACWESEKLFESDAPATTAPSLTEKFMVTFPYPYMNGRLHLGHSFSLSKAEFAAGFERMRGKRVLFPFGFHCTGMPIKAAADKLRKEMAQFGCPPVFPCGDSDSTTTTTNSKHSKVSAKTGGVKYQWQIMEQLGVGADEIPRFADPAYWTQFFPPRAEHDLRQFGAGIDWRRSFITTDLNPFYDAFIQWQFRRLKGQGKITFGKRYCVYSPLDQQPCMDHDRASGEGVEPKEYTAIKLELVECERFFKQHLTVPANCKVFLVGATLRPETMYGQTNCWVGPDIEYGVFQVTDSELFVCTERAALNMAHQGHCREHGKVERVGSVMGRELIGEWVKAPLVPAPIPVLPMMTVVATIGTGIVTSVPGSSADDFACLRDLKEKEALRCKFKLTDQHVLPLTPTSVVKTELLGELGAETVVKQLMIRSQNDRDLLDKAKDMLYKEEFYNGTMTVGEFAGTPVQEAKPAVRRILLDTNQAIPYWEPEKRVVSRSGDDCVVCLTDQWFIAYGEPQWRAEAERALAKMNCFSAEVRNQFEATLQWMQQWACSRSFGLGSKMPWDPQFLIESLSDSTIYMAYYCIAHLLHQGSLDGSVSPNGVTVAQMTDAVFDHVFADGPQPTDSDIDVELLSKMRHEFRYFYPLDLRVSGKDLVPNHLTFFLYNHVALFDEQWWPRGVRANGHLLLNGQKMSKSTGNFMTMSEACARFGADATRIALADAGDGLEDANFVEDTADKAILRLFTNLEAIRDIYDHPESYRRGSDLFADRVFAAEMQHYTAMAVKAYDQMNFREALHAALFGLHNCRDAYRDMTVVNGHSGMSLELMDRFARLSCQLLAPICPHYCDHVFRNVIKAGSVFAAGLPVPCESASADNQDILKAAEYIRQTAHGLRAQMSVVSAKQQQPVKKAQLFVASQFPKWQDDVIAVLQAHGSAQDDQLVKALKPVIAEHSKQPGVSKKIIPFAMELKRKMATDPEALNRLLPFDEEATVGACVEYLRESLGLLSLEVVKAGGDLTVGCGDDEKAVAEMRRKAETAEPGRPSVRLL